ncbi:MAG: hypothetical protein NT027_07710 [Proteobacteria bacterium]|nr:hypothetical protein [Pseudomonadota bacterium]
MDLSGEISKVVEHLKANRAVPDEDYESYLTILESFECWDSWFKLVKAHCYSSPAGFADDQCRLARVHLRYFDDVNSAAESCRAIVESTGMNFSNFRSAILDRVIELEDFAYATSRVEVCH